MIRKPVMFYPLILTLAAAAFLGIGSGGLAVVVGTACIVMACFEWRAYWIISDAYKQQQAQK